MNRIEWINQSIIGYSTTAQHLPVPYQFNNILYGRLFARQGEKKINKEKRRMERKRSAKLTTGYNLSQQYGTVRTTGTLRWKELNSMESVFFGFLFVVVARMHQNQVWQHTGHVTARGDTVIHSFILIFNKPITISHLFFHVKQPIGFHVRHADVVCFIVWDHFSLPRQAGGTIKANVLCETPTFNTAFRSNGSDQHLTTVSRVMYQRRL